MKDVFISYSSKDRVVAEKVCAILEANSIECWIAPRNIMPGKEWGEQIIRGIENSKIFVLIFSKGSNESVQVLREVERAVSKQLPIINFRVEDLMPTGSMEYFLCSNHWVDAFSGGLDQQVLELVTAVKELSKQESVKNERASEVLTSHQLANAHIKKKRRYIKLVVVATGTIIVATMLFFLNEIRVSLQKLNAQQSTTNETGVKMEQQEDAVVALGGLELINQHKNNEPTEGVENKLDVVVGDSNREADKDVKQQEVPQVTIIQDEYDEIGKDEVGQKQDIEDIEEVETVESIEVQVGDYIRFGLYQNAPVDWIVIHVKEDGSPLLLAKNILALKSLDSAESGKYNESNSGEAFDVKKTREQVYSDYPQDVLREMKGSNYWGTSNLRTWLNSDERKVDYPANAPTKEAVGGRENDYFKEAGFLNAFSKEEKALILDTTYKSILAITDMNQQEGGTEQFEFEKTSVIESGHNAERAYYEHLTDKIFLLSVEEVVLYLEGEYIDLKAKPTQEAIQNDKSGWYKDLVGQTGGYHMWWLRTPVGQSPSEMCAVGHKGDVIYSEYVTSAGIGVRPALCLDFKKATIEGSGEEDEPYIIK